MREAKENAMTNQKTKKLELTRTTLRNLTPTEIEAVAGGASGGCATFWDKSSPL